MGPLLLGLVCCSSDARTKDIDLSQQIEVSQEEGSRQASANRDLKQEQIEDYAAYKNELFDGLTDFYACCHTEDRTVVYTYMFYVDDSNQQTLDAIFTNMCKEGPNLLAEAQYYAPAVESLTIEILDAGVGHSVLYSKDFSN